MHEEVNGSKTNRYAKQTLKTRRKIFLFLFVSNALLLRTSMLQPTFI